LPDGFFYFQRGSRKLAPSGVEYFIASGMNGFMTETNCVIGGAEEMGEFRVEGRLAREDGR
jgi:hypothetical protein